MGWIRSNAKPNSGLPDNTCLQPFGGRNRNILVKFIETLKLALAAIWAHKLRSALTLLGMIIGIMAVVVVYSLIQGFNTYVDEKIAGIGAKSFNVQRFNPLEDFKDTDTIAAAQRARWAKFRANRKS